MQSLTIITQHSSNIKSRNVNVNSSAELSSWGPVPNADGGPVLSHSLVPIPAVPLTASRLKWPGTLAGFFAVGAKQGTIAAYIFFSAFFLLCVDAVLYIRSHCN